MRADASSTGATPRFHMVPLGFKERGTPKTQYRMDVSLIGPIEFGVPLLETQLRRSPCNLAWPGVKPRVESSNLKLRASLPAPVSKSCIPMLDTSLPDLTGTHKQTRHGQYCPWKGKSLEERQADQIGSFLWDGSPDQKRTSVCLSIGIERYVYSRKRRREA